MKIFLKSSFFILVIVMLTSCSAFKTSMSPLEIYSTLPTLTKSRLLKEGETSDTLCSCITRGRTYNAPKGLTVKHDLILGAQGIDEWVTIDKGNAYKLINYNWVTVGYNAQYGTTATQLVLEFDTYLCK